MITQEGWKFSESGMACNADPQLGGIIDKAIVSGLWFIIFNDNALDVIEGLHSQEEAFEVFNDTINKKYLTK